jgi:multidrug efflux pump subunit AcrA (membrane-fusion protein)
MSQSKYKKHTKRKKRQSRWQLFALIGGGLSLILIAVFAFGQSAKPKTTIEVTGAPALKVDKEQVDLGQIKLGRTVEVSFRVTNVGDKTLRFTKTPYIEVKEGC